MAGNPAGYEPWCGVTVAAPSHGFEVAADREAGAFSSNAVQRQPRPKVSIRPPRRYSAAMRDSTTSDDLRAQGWAAHAEGRYDEAAALYADAVAADPRSGPAHHDLGCLQKALGQLDAARESLETACLLLPEEPRSRHALGGVLLALGHYGEGGALSDARYEIPELGLRKPPFTYPEWQGEDPAGRSILLFPEQGLGDQIQYARFAPWLAARGADVTLLCHPALQRLFAQSLDVRVLAARGQVEFPDPDAWVMTGSVTGRSGLTPETLPNAPYLRAAGERRPGVARIGVATRGNPAHANDAHRSLPPEMAAQLLALPGAISLHPEDTGARDFADTAEIVAGLDLVVSVDTSVAHLAGAMGKPVWILLPQLMTDWRWMQGRADSPWYPSARLFRQPAAGDWASVIEQVRRELAATLR